MRHLFIFVIGANQAYSYGFEAQKVLGLLK